MRTKLHGTMTRERIRPARLALAGFLLVALVAVMASPAPPAFAAAAGSRAPRDPTDLVAAAPTIPQLIGQKLMVAMRGTTPDAGILDRVRNGEIGGVILFGANITSARQLALLTEDLRQAAAAGGQPPPLIAVDQEGGLVKRIGWAPPTLSPPQMGALGSVTTAREQGTATGIVLACAGIIHDLAPVADVPSSTSSFMYQEGRTWSFDPSVTATLSDAFATGLRAGGTVATMKHFPGIGRATKDTDLNVVTIGASADALAPGLRPYRRAIDHRIPMIMLSNATYLAYDRGHAAGWSHAISVGLLRDTLGFTGVSITDSLSGTAAARGLSPASLAIRAARAGTDMILLTGPESESEAAYASLVTAAQNGGIPLSRLRDSYDRILALKGKLASPPDDTTGPTLRRPSSRLYAGPKLGFRTTPVRSGWSANDPCGVSRYALQRQVNGGAWKEQAKGLASSIGQSLAFGATYRYRLKATDGAGNTSDWRYGRSFIARRTEQSSSHVRYRGTWHAAQSKYASGGSLVYSTTAGASAKFTFIGFSVSWVANRGPDRGSAAVYIDGSYRTTVNLHAAAADSRVIVFSARWLTAGEHTVYIVNNGTAGHPRIDVDAFVQLLPA